MSVNGKELKGLIQLEALNLLKNFTATVHLTVNRRVAQEVPRSYTLSAVDLRPPSKMFTAAMKAQGSNENHLPTTKSFSHFTEKRARSRKNVHDNGVRSFDLTVGNGVRNSMYGDTEM